MNSVLIGHTTYSVTKEGKYFYLHLDTGCLHDKYKISFAKDDNKARIYIAPLREYIYLNSDARVLNLLQAARA
jgi:hypothetical protein